jgi:hypothetical protein
MVATDTNPSDAFRRIAALPGVEREADITLYVGHPLGTPHDEACMRAAIAQSDVLIVGMSSSPALAAMEIEAIRTAHICHKPYGFFSDAPGCYAREWFEPYRNDASFIAVVHESDVVQANRLFPNAIVTLTHHPKEEDDGVRKMTTEGVRARLGLLPSDERKLVVIAGTKTLEINKETIRATQGALGTSPQWYVVFSKHPGDKNPNSEYKLTDAVSTGQLVEKALVPSEELILAADVFINILSTMIRRAAHFEVPTVCYCTPAIQDVREKQLGRPFPVEFEEGVTAIARDHAEFERVLYALASGTRDLRPAQRARYGTLPAPGSGARTLLDLARAQIPSISSPTT